MHARVLAILVSLTGCDSLFGLHDSKPSDAGGTGDGVSGDGGNDGANDGIASCAFTSDSFVIGANSWTPSADLLAASRTNAGNIIEFGKLPSKSAFELTATDYQPIGVAPPPGFTGLGEPALSASGDQIVVRMQYTTGGLRFGLGITTRQAAAWATLAVQTVLDDQGTVYDLTLAELPSAISATTPRRMLVTSTANLRELVEGPAGTWRVVHTYLPAELGVASVGSGNLTADGLTLVFGGTPDGTTSQIYRADRASLDLVFPAAVALYHSATSLRSPYLAPNCGALSFLGVSDVRRAQ
ncbi:MAG: hypothetical protein IPQ07_32365 [Myxococcales bacterium]|nr:hypothetical protein [Myxococcales bacterium]